MHSLIALHSKSRRAASPTTCPCTRLTAADSCSRCPIPAAPHHHTNSSMVYIAPLPSSKQQQRGRGGKAGAGSAAACESVQPQRRADDQQQHHQHAKRRSQPKRRAQDADGPLLEQQLGEESAQAQRNPPGVGRRPADTDTPACAARSTASAAQHPGAAARAGAAAGTPDAGAQGARAARVARVLKRSRPCLLHVLHVLCTSGWWQPATAAARPAGRCGTAADSVPQPSLL